MLALSLWEQLGHDVVDRRAERVDAKRPMEVEDRNDVCESRDVLEAVSVVTTGDAKARLPEIRQCAHRLDRLEAKLTLGAAEKQHGSDRNWVAIVVDAAGECIPRSIVPTVQAATDSHSEAPGDVIA